MKMNKKRFLRTIRTLGALLALLSITLSFSAAAFASDEEENYGEIPFLTDENSYLTEEEADTVCGMLSDIYDDYGYRLVIYTEPELPSEYDDGEERAYDLYYQYADFSGILFYVSGDRYYHLLTVSEGYYVFGSDEVTEIEDAILTYMRDNEMFDAFTEYARVGRTILENADLEEARAQYEDYMNCISDGTIDDEENGFPWLFVFAALVISLIAAAVMTGVKSAAMKTARAQSGAGNYLRSGSLNIKQQKDIFLYSTVTRTAKPDDNNDSSSGDGGGGGSRGSTGGHGGRF